MNKPRIGLSLSCIDYRLFDATIELLRKDCQVDGFDHTILAGASLGYNQHDYKTWQRTWLDHVDLALKLHNIKVILVIDHQDCGFYKAIYKNAKDCEKCERALHIKNIKKFLSMK